MYYAAFVIKYGINGSAVQVIKVRATDQYNPLAIINPYRTHYKGPSPSPLFT